MKNYITEHDVANEIRMKMIQFDGAFIIVEGDTDSRFYKKFIDENQCFIIPGHSKSNVIGAIKLLEDYVGIIGIVDADYYNIEKNENKKLDHENIFITDTHDIETMIIKSPALKDFMCEYVDHNKLNILLENKQKEDLRELLIESTLYIGYARWVALSNNLYLRFKELDFNKFHSKTLSFLKTKFLEELINNSENYKGDVLSISKIIDNVDKSHDPWQICSGHDMSKVLLIGLHSIFGYYTATSLDNTGKLEGSLRMCYESIYFKETRLYKEIKGWENNNPFTIFNKDKFEDYEVSA